MLLGQVYCLAQNARSMGPLVCPRRVISSKRCSTFSIHQSPRSALGGLQALGKVTTGGGGGASATLQERETGVATPRALLRCTSSPRNGSGSNPLSRLDLMEMRHHSIEWLTCGQWDRPPANWRQLFEWLRWHCKVSKHCQHLRKTGDVYDKYCTLLSY